MNNAPSNCQDVRVCASHHQQTHRVLVKTVHCTTSAAASTICDDDPQCYTPSNFLLPQKARPVSPPRQPEATAAPQESATRNSVQQMRRRASTGGSGQGRQTAPAPTARASAWRTEGRRRRPRRRQPARTQQPPARRRPTARPPRQRRAGRPPPPRPPGGVGD
ncbi:hypothetical protein BU14_0242s0003 [Porphyra umbilicalis]|uniref:Uncharacterized protein n=1 Tax=Porphyra umbilicalis TaxID=2786 RepID=A0A1X6P3E4_PORUM|nr:hypothetical protein BU14_0242s0003 [Porphyra umbilicalis]|eukprot:OSX75285.1 hypothetical protein BU14_0242s0003 [Porphyra umbilicalis]